MAFRRKRSDPRSDERLVIGQREGTLLRRSALDDRDEFVAAMQSSTALHAPWMTPSSPERDPDGDHGFRNWCSALESARRRVFFICRADGGQLAGGVALSEIVRGDFQSAYCSYWAAAPLAGLGHMTAGLELLLEHSFTELGLHRLEANIQPGNERSLALVKRVGFLHEGFSPRYLRINGDWRDHERWALLVDDWRARVAETAQD